MNTTEGRMLEWLNENIGSLTRYRANPMNAKRTAVYDEQIEQQRTAISAIETCRQLKKSLFGKENVTNDELVRMVSQLKSGRCEDREGAEKGGRAMKATPDELKRYAQICKTMMTDALAYIEQLEAEREGKSDENA